jgi:hypothetical protein
MTYFNAKGENHSGKELFDRDGFVKVDVQHEIANVDLNEFPALSDIVRCHYALKVWHNHPNEVPQTIFSRIK